jgi:hypothetical protein
MHASVRDHLGSLIHRTRRGGHKATKFRAVHLR